MKKIRFRPVLAFMILGTFMLASCAQEFKLDSTAVQYQLNEEPLTAHGNQARLDVQYQIAPKKLTKTGVAVMTLIERSGNQSKVIARDLIQGPKVKGLNGKQADPSKETAGTLTLQESLGENPTNRSYSLEVSSFGGSKKNVKAAKAAMESGSTSPWPAKTYRFEVALTEGPSLLARTATYTSAPRSIASGFVPDTIQPFEATIYFELNKSTIRESERKRKEILQLVNFLSKTKEILKIEVNGYASPDGELQFNNELANERAGAGGKFVVDALRSSTGLKDINFDINNRNLYVQNQGTEDWKGLLQGIEFARIPNKEKVVEIIRNTSLSSTEKQSQLRAMNDAWEIITEEYLPPLRRANMVIQTKVAPRTMEERMELIRIPSSDISAAEMLATAEQASSATQAADILEKTKQRYPADHRAYNNLAVMDIQAGRLETASKNLDAAAEVAPASAEVLANQAMVAAGLGDWKKLELVVKRAQANGQSLSGYEAALLIRQGKYQDALQKLSGNTSGSLQALALILQKDYTKAAESLKTQASSTDATVLYLRAVLAARTRNATELQPSVERLVAAYPEFKDKIAVDPEFAALRQEILAKKP
ncbi:MAG: hypothetical protein ACO39U_02750 [Bacteroidia bacterium]